MSTVQQLIKAYDNIPPWLNIGANLINCKQLFYENGITLLENVTWSCQGGVNTSAVDVELCFVGKMAFMKLYGFTATSGNVGTTCVLNTLLPIDFLPSETIFLGSVLMAGTAINNANYCSVYLSNQGQVFITQFDETAFTNAQILQLPYAVTFSWIVS